MSANPLRKHSASTTRRLMDQTEDAPLHPLPSRMSGISILHPDPAEHGPTLALPNLQCTIAPSRMKARRRMTLRLSAPQVQEKSRLSRYTPRALFLPKPAIRGQPHLTGSWVISSDRPAHAFSEHPSSGSKRDTSFAALRLAYAAPLRQPAACQNLLPAGSAVDLATIPSWPYRPLCREKFRSEAATAPASHPHTRPILSVWDSCSGTCSVHFERKPRSVSWKARDEQHLGLAIPSALTFANVICSAVSNGAFRSDLEERKVPYLFSSRLPSLAGFLPGSVGSPSVTRNIPGR